MDSQEKVDSKINAAFALADVHTTHCSTPAFLDEFELLFSPTSVDSLGYLGSLHQVPPTAPPNASMPLIFKVLLGFGNTFAEARDLHSFFNGMIEFEPQPVFARFMQQAYAVVVTAGDNQNIVAAASFIVASDGVFVDAIAVSHGRHAKAFKLNNVDLMTETDIETFASEHNLTNLMLSDASDGNFQNFGLGAFLLSFITRCASLRCSQSASVFLKAHKKSQSFYSKRGFVPVAKTVFTAYRNLFSMVPEVHRQIGPETCLMEHRSASPAVDSLAESIEEVHRPASPALESFAEPIEEDVAAAKVIVDRPVSPALESPAEPIDEDVAAAKVIVHRDATPIIEPLEESIEADVAAAKVIANLSSAAPTSTSKQRKKKRKLLAAELAFLRVQLASSSDEDEAQSDSDGHALPLGPEPTWELPKRDFWKPQLHSKFKAKEPEQLHQLSQIEVCAKHHVESTKVLGRRAVIMKAMHYKAYTLAGKNLESPYNRRYNLDFTDQDYINFAAVTDPNRPLDVNGVKAITSDNLVEVTVSSYTLPDDMFMVRLLHDAPSLVALEPSVQTFDVCLTWLLNHTRPDVAVWIDETLFGTKVQRIRGSEASMDALSLGFSGSLERDKHFVSLPQGHRSTKFAPSAPSSSRTGPRSRKKLKLGRKGVKAQLKSSATMQSRSSARHVAGDAVAGVYYDTHGNSTGLLERRMRADAKAIKVPYKPPPPKANTQIVKLKWVVGHIPTTGMWHGAFAVRVGTDKASTVLQECGLLPDWVETEFAAGFLDECRLIAAGNTRIRNPKSLLFIPAGDVHDTNIDPPPATELLEHVATTYLQGDLDSCLRDSLASALASMGFVSEAKELTLDASLVGCNLDLVERTASLLQKLFVASHLRLTKLANHACSVAQIAAEDSTWPILLIIQTSDGCHGAHAVTVWNHMIFDSNYQHPLRWSQKALDWCSGENTKCVGFSRAYRVCPADNGATSTHSTFPVGLQVQQSVGVFTWIISLPSKRKKDYEVRNTNGLRIRMCKDKVAECQIARSTVGEYYSF